MSEDALEAVGRALSTRGRAKGGAGGQTVEATMRATFHEISAYDLDIVLEALHSLRARVAELEGALKRIAADWDGDIEWPGGAEEEAASYASRARAALTPQGER